LFISRQEVDLKKQFSQLILSLCKKRNLTYRNDKSELMKMGLSRQERPAKSESDNQRYRRWQCRLTPQWWINYAR